MQPEGLLAIAAAALIAALLFWFGRDRLWRRPRLSFVAVALAVGLLLLLRRVRWPELLVIAAVLLVPVILVPARKGRPRR